MKRNEVATCLAVVLAAFALVAVGLLLVAVGLTGLLGPSETADGEPRDPPVLERIGGAVFIAGGFFFAAIPLIPIGIAGWAMVKLTWRRAFGIRRTAEWTVAASEAAGDRRGGATGRHPSPRHPDSGGPPTDELRDVAY
jgi:hypothetical protein